MRSNGRCLTRCIRTQRLTFAVDRADSHGGQQMRALRCCRLQVVESFVASRCRRRLRRRIRLRRLASNSRYTRQHVIAKLRSKRSTASWNSLRVCARFLLLLFSLARSHSTTCEARARRLARRLRASCVAMSRRSAHPRTLVRSSRAR